MRRCRDVPSVSARYVRWSWPKRSHGYHPRTGFDSTFHSRIRSSVHPSSHCGGCALRSLSSYTSPASSGEAPPPLGWGFAFVASHHDWWSEVEPIPIDPIGIEGSTVTTLVPLLGQTSPSPSRAGTSCFANELDVEGKTTDSSGQPMAQGW